MKIFNQFFRNESGATAIEYGLILGLMTLTIVGSISALGGTNGGLFESNSDQIGAAMEDAGN